MRKILLPNLQIISIFLMGVNICIAQDNLNYLGAMEPVNIYDEKMETLCTSTLNTPSNFCDNNQITNQFSIKGPLLEGCEEVNYSIKSSLSLDLISPAEKLELAPLPNAKYLWGWGDNSVGGNANSGINWAATYGQSNQPLFEFKPIEQSGSIVCPTKVIPISTEEALDEDKMTKAVTAVNETPETSGNVCCTSGICRISDKYWSCNLVDNSIIEDEENVDVYSLMSHIALDGNAKGASGTPFQGTKKFCSACYSKIFKEQYADKKDTYEKELSDLENQLKDELTSRAVSKFYSRMFQQHFEQKMYYEEHKAEIDAFLNEKFGDNEVEKNKIKDAALCISQNYLEDTYSSEKFDNECPNGVKNLKKFIENNNLSIGEIENVYSPETMVKLNVSFDTLSETYSASVNQEKKNNPDLYPKNIEQFFVKMFVDNRAKIVSICDEMNDESPQTKIDAIYEAVVKGQQESVSKELLKYRTESLNKVFLVSGMVNPNFMAFTRSPEMLCGLASAEDIDIARIKESYIKDWVNSTRTGEEHFRILKNIADNSCNNKKMRMENAKLLCGELDNTSVPIKLNLDSLGGGKYGEAKKLALAKLQCENNFGFINTSKKDFPGYDPTMSSEAVFHALSKEGGIKKVIDEVGNTAGAGSRSPAGLGTLDGDGSPKGTSLTNSEKDKLDSELGLSLGSGADNLDKRSGRLKYSDRVIERQNKVLARLGEHSIDSKSQSNSNISNSSQTSSSENNNIKSKSDTDDSLYDSSKTYSNFQKQSTNSQYSGSRYPVTSNDVEKYIDKNPKFEKILENMEGSPADKQQEIADYINGSAGAPQFKRSTPPAQKDDLAKQLAQLKEELELEKQKSRQRDLNTELANAQERLNKLKNLASETQYQPDGRTFSSTSGVGTQIKNADQIIKSLPRENLGTGGGEGYTNFTNQHSKEFLDSYNKALEGINKNININDQGVFKYSDNQLVLIASNKEYKVNLQDIVVEKGEVKQIIIDGTEYTMEDLKTKFHFDALTITQLNTFAKEALKAKIGLGAKEVLTIAAEKKVPVSSQNPNIAMYVDLLCTMNPSDPSCIKK